MPSSSRLGDWRPRDWRQRVFFAVLVVLVGAGVGLRVGALDRLPGVNGDEGFYGTIVLAQMVGENPPWISGSGLPLNPCYAGLLYLIHLINPQPSFFLLRLPAVLSGLACLGLSYPLLSRVLDRSTALVTTLLLACAPIMIGYTRLGWDQSQAPLASLLCIYFALRKEIFGAAASFGFALLIHPVNGLLLPVMLGPLAVEQWQAMQAAAEPERSRLRNRALLATAGIAVLGVAAAGLLASGVAIGGWVANLPAIIGGRLVSPWEWGEFALRWSDLLTGYTIEYYVAGPPPVWSLWLQRGLFGAVFVALLVFGLPTLRRERDPKTLGLLGGLLVCLVGFYLVLGIRLIGPALERYALLLVVPSCLGLAILARAATEGRPHGEFMLRAGTVVVGALLLASFAAWYWVPLLETGGATHRTFRTAANEPKATAFAAIRAAVPDGRPVTIVAEDWWCYYPLRYLSYGRPDTEVMQLDRRDVKPEDIARAAARPRRRFAVGFVGGPFADWMKANAPHLPRTTIVDGAGRPFLLMWDLGMDGALVPALAEAARTAPPDAVPE